MISSTLAYNDSFGSFEYNYSLQRQALQDEEHTFAGYRKVYDENEQIVYSYLEYLKWEEFSRTRDDFPPARPVKLHIADIKQSKIYKLLKKFPKGGNMHLHHNHVVSKSKILDLIFASPLYDNLYVKTDPPKQWNMDFFLNPPTGWVKVRDNSTYTKDILVQHSTFLGIIDDKAINDPTDSGLRWKEIGPLFSVIGSHIINNANFTKLYVDAMLQAAIDENVQYLEAKSSAYNKLYVLDRDKKYASRNGKHFIDNNDGELELQMVEEVVQQFKGSHPNFIGYKRIINSYRGGIINNVGQDVQKALRLHQKYPNLVSGFDLVSEEDRVIPFVFSLKTFPKYQFRT
ncbi:CECR1 [Mytilus coruscus]|uniref:CECR1 n=1 Tax=Mytilus coruscus TaxID=42192 RepID=A0A6J8D4A7_MYTCO|nr:CECR1 [Mytilus coruscus]